MSDQIHTRRGQARLNTARNQFGLLTSVQLRSTGWSKQSVFRQVRAGALEPFLPGVFAMAGHPHSFQRDLMGAILHSGPGSAAAVRSAAWAWGFDGFNAIVVEVSSVGRKKPPASLPSGRRLVVHRVDHHLLDEITTAAGLPVTSVRKTLLDLAGSKHPRAGRALDQAVHKGLTTLGEMWLLYEQEWIRGRRGVAILRNLLQERTPGTAPSQSDLEDLFWKLVKDYKLPSPQPQHRVELGSAPVHVDFAFPDARLAVECDSFAWHADRSAFERDRARDIELQAQGWVILRFTWAKLRYEPRYVADQIRHHLRTRAPNRRV